MTYRPGDDSEFEVGDSEFVLDDSEFEVGGLGPAPDPEVESEGDLLPEPEPEYHTALPPKIESWRKRSATGAILTGFALGLQEALETRRQEPSIVIQTSGDPPRDLPVEADFEYGRPRQTVVNIRPWLLDGPAPEQDSEGPGPSAGEAGRSSGESEAGPDQP